MYDEEDLLKRFDEYIEDPEAFYTIFQYLPTGYQYHLILSLLEYETELEHGDKREGIPTRGNIQIKDRKIILTDKNNIEHTLTKLPNPYYI